MIQAILFDMDGTLTDTEKYLTRFQQQVMGELGYEIPIEETYQFRSYASKFSRVRAKELYGEDFDYDNARARRRKIMNEHIEKNGIELKPYVKETVKELQKRGYQTIVVTATNQKAALECLEKAGIKDLFDTIVSTSMVENGKPCPDVYLYACREIGKKPEECLAVEDSPNGVTSAWKAGCRVAMVPDLTGPDENTEGKTDYVFDTLKELLEIL